MVYLSGAGPLGLPAIPWTPAKLREGGVGVPSIDGAFLWRVGSGNRSGVDEGDEAAACDGVFHVADAPLYETGDFDQYDAALAPGAAHNPMKKICATMVPDGSTGVIDISASSFSVAASRGVVILLLSPPPPASLLTSKCMGSFRPRHSAPQLSPCLRAIAEVSFGRLVLEDPSGLCSASISIALP